MKLLVFSDSHGNVDHMRRGIEKEKPDMILHLGDMVRDARRLGKRFPKIPMELVRGNCDPSGSALEEQELLVHGKRLWILHGHVYQVKWGLQMLREEARTRGVDAVFFGHTHTPLCSPEGAFWMVNPGTCQGFPNATCAIVEIAGEKLTCRIADLREM